MSNSLIETEVKKVFEDSQYEGSLKHAMSAAWILGHFKGLNLKIYNVSGSSSLADYFILASVNSHVQANSMADSLMRQFKKLGVRHLSAEGLDADSDWTLIDLGDIIVHIFLDTSRDIYDLDSLWRGSEQVNIPTEFYVSDDQETTSNSGPGYF